MEAMIYIEDIVFFKQNKTEYLAFSYAMRKLEELTMNVIFPK